MTGEPQYELKEQWPSLPRGANGSLRERLAELGRRDLYYLTQGILGYDKLTPHTHGAFTKFCSETPKIVTNGETRLLRRRMIQMPRSHFKTTIATISHSIQLILNDPNVRILLVASSAANAERFLQEIKNHFVRNELFRWLYPDLIPQNTREYSWNKQEMTVPRSVHWREPTIDTIGSKGDVQSRHYNWIKADDIIGEKELQSDAEMSKTIEWSSGLESLLVSPVTDFIDYIGTRWRMDDVYAWVENFYAGTDKVTERSLGPYAIAKGELAIFRREALEDGKPIFPEQISLEFLSRLMRENPERYAAQYANNPKAKGITTFNEGWLRYYNLHDVREDGDIKEASVSWYDPVAKREESVPIEALDRILLFDPAVAEHKKSARNAMILCGVYERARSPLVFILETRIGHYKPHTAVDHIFDLDRKWQPRLVSVERFGYQGSIKYWLQERAERDHLPYPNLVEYPPKGTGTSQLAKDERIKGLQPLFRNGQILMLDSMLELREEYLYYPRGTFRDALDALAQGLAYWRTSFDESRRDASLAHEERLIASIGPTGYSIMKGSPMEYELDDPYPEEYDEIRWRHKTFRVG